MENLIVFYRKYIKNLSFQRHYDKQTLDVCLKILIFVLVVRINFKQDSNVCLFYKFTLIKVWFVMRIKL